MLILEIILLYSVITQYVIKCYCLIDWFFVWFFIFVSVRIPVSIFDFYVNEFRHFSRICYISCFIYKSYSINNIPTFRPSFEKPSPHPRRNIKNIPQNRPFLFLQNYLPFFYPIFIKKCAPLCDYRVHSIMIRNV